MILFLAGLSCVLAQDQNLACEFFIQWNGYICSLNDITVTDPAQHVTFSGTHWFNQSDETVAVFRVQYSHTPFVIQQAFTAFTNMRIFQILYSQLESINIPSTFLLEELVIHGNNISRIESGMFEGQSQLNNLNLRDNGIEEIDEDAFTGLESVATLILISNRLQTIAPRTFHPLVNISYIDLEGNMLTSIGDDVFMQSRSLRSLYLLNNAIDAISPRFTSAFTAGLYINLSGNVCVDRNFNVADDDFTRIVMHNSLRTCFTNFLGPEDDLRRVVFEYRGHMRLFDEFGNLVANL